MRFAIALLLTLSLGAVAAQAEIPNKSRARLLKASTHVVTGTVKAVYERTTMAGAMRTTHYVVEVALLSVEHGDGLKARDLVYARFWRKAWTGDAPSPGGAYGHRPMPQAGDTLRIHLAKQASDGGLDVVLPNGFERLPVAK